MNAMFQRFFQRFPLLVHVGGAAIMGGVAEAIDDRWVKHHIHTMTDQIDEELVDNQDEQQQSKGQISHEITGGVQPKQKHSNRKQSTSSQRNDENSSFWDSYFDENNQQSTYWGRILESSVTSALLIGPLARFWYPFLHRLTLSRSLLNRPVNFKVAFMTAMDMLPFAGSTILNMLFVSRGFEYLERMGVIRFPDTLKRKIEKGLEASERNEEHVIEIELSEIIDLQKLRK
eukprot:gb/GECG01015551.1/.p1 GENE.gb/GECG01015551.1/~~gb/GECG01015551.1/.p1  ORF type:complete len:231 (+),score=36.37 gb/GECG01015551.1/:1-693(+)